VSRHYLACDLGAESGRLMLATLADGRLSLEELHRFPNGAIAAGTSLHWDIARLFRELEVGLAKAAARNIPIASISTDSWGVDYVLIDTHGGMVEPTFHYRDPRTAEGVRRLHARLGQEQIFAESGIQFMPLNTIFQLAAEPPARLRSARWIVPIADAFNLLLSGTVCVEVSNASTTSLYNPVRREWSAPLLDALDISATKFPRIVASGTKLGPIRKEVARSAGLPQIEVIAGCSHDTAAAVLAVPAENAGATLPDWAYISSGTWSLLGTELGQPVLTTECRDANFTNEIGYGNSVRLLKNIIGLWLVQECRRAWASAGQEFSYAQLADLAAPAKPFASLFYPADSRFVSPGDMPGRIAELCRETGEPVPASPGACIRAVLESLALLYSVELSRLERVGGTRFTRLHVVGGGSQNALLNQFTAEACGIPVHAGPVEATAAGNALVQAITLGDLSGMDAARSVVRASYPVKTYTPSNDVEWGRAKARFARLCEPQL
jgi:rhamnulokinase